MAQVPANNSIAATLMGSNSTKEPPQWNSEPMFQLPQWGEPLIVFLILALAMIATRRRGFKVFRRRYTKRLSILDRPRPARSTDQLLGYDSENEDDAQDYIAAFTYQRKRRYCCGVAFTTPNTSRFADNLRSRIMQKFPFLVEMFYWIITYFFYRMTKVISQRVFAKTGIWDVALQNGVRVLEWEQSGWLSFLFPWTEHDIQQWFMNGHQTSLTALNRFYALVHIPGTVGFIAWYYYIAPSHRTFAIVRRTLTLTNLLAFVTFTFYPCMPPRLLPPEYGFLDSVRHDNAQSIWMSGNYVNSLAAMPSMHFGYSFCIGCTMLYHTGIFRRSLERGETRKTTFWKLWYLSIAVAYPVSVLMAIVATANHYWLDALAAVGVVCVAFLCNRVFLLLLPIEDLLYWSLLMERPTPSTGERFHNRGGSI
ncbi:hypothetical protein AJ79_02837 [Helicocarpus griseus UAMH5409]|uniref:Inositolphosphotransferase Aur1/Ipt1 domain-containing protein n=1 Tax=Helicocarpus griseus UAMH5409 TaxID=1447875 RepID=A0A2B7Y1A3_9EURO|nr:hypothetical protein AJ79_02837 [Helicocarpus griseus UAMH5409]